MLNSMKKFQLFNAKSPEIRLATSPAEQAVHGILFTFNLRTFGYRLLLVRAFRTILYLQIKDVQHLIFENTTFWVESNAVTVTHFLIQSQGH